MNIQQKNGKYYPKNKLELKRLVSNENVYLGDIDTSAVSDMSGLFVGSKRENFSGIKSWDVSNVLNMADMFNGAKHFNVALDEWNLNENADFSGMFDNTSVSLNEIFKNNKNAKIYHPKTKDELKKLVGDEGIYLGNIDTSFITDMSELFKYSGRIDFSGIKSWDVSNVKNMSYMFYVAENFNSDISAWDVSNVKNMSYMFYKATNFNSDISGWDVSNVENMSRMFYGARKFNGDISGWDIKDEICIDSLDLQNYPKNFTIPKDENGKYKPKKALELYFLVRKDIALRDIDTSEITNMSGLFSRMDRDDFDDISGWDVSNVKDMSYMFYEASDFNSDISGWDVSNVENMSEMFYYATNFNSNISGWDVSNVEDMSQMFCGAENFNSNISGWDVSNVKNMSYMFYGATNFNSDISGWDVSNVKNMEAMFEIAISMPDEYKPW